MNRLLARPDQRNTKAPWRVILISVLLAWLPCCQPGRPWVNYGTDTAAPLAAPSPAEGYTVAILADRTGGDESGIAVLERAVSELNLLGPDLVLHIGDLVPGYIRDMEEWERDIERVKEVLGRLEAPLFPLPGNHDVITGTDDPQDRRGEALYKAHFGPLYYSFDHRDAHFVCLYTEETLRSAPRLGAAQLGWLRADLAASRARHVFVLMHKPLWEYADSGWDEAHALLRQYPVRAVFAGHFHHYYKSDLRNGIQYYVLGVTGGRTFSPELAGGLEHYCLLRIRPDGYRLSLVKPGHVLPDDYVGLADYKDMERIRWLSPEQTGLLAPVDSPESQPVASQVRVSVTNPLDRPLDVALRGLARGGWTFGGHVPKATVAGGGQLEMSLPIRSERVSAAEFIPPDVEIEYTYPDAQGRTVSIGLRRRVPLRREAAAPLGRPELNLDGRAEEREWALAPVLKAAVWEAGPYETGQPEPVFRVLATPDGLCFHVESQDSHVSDFRGERMLSDAIFVGAIASLAPGRHDSQRPPVVVVFPFAREGEENALRAEWDPRRPRGAPVEGVRAAAVRTADGAGWTCEGFVHWQALIAELAPPPCVLHFNIGAWDNDGDLFTELHSWAPTDDANLWGNLRIPAP